MYKIIIRIGHIVEYTVLLVRGISGIRANGYITYDESDKVWKYPQNFRNRAFLARYHLGMHLTERQIMHWGEND